MPMPRFVAHGTEAIFLFLVPRTNTLAHLTDAEVIDVHDSHHSYYYAIQIFWRHIFMPAKKRLLESGLEHYLPYVFPKRKNDLRFMEY